MGLKSLLTTTPKSRRNYKTAAVAGLVGDVFSAIVKFGWEVPFPPRTPERSATNPPRGLLERLGMSSEANHTAVAFNGNELPIYSFAIHFSFAAFFALAYCLIAEKYPKAKPWQGAACGLTSWVLFHVVLMPTMSTVPAPWDQPFEGHFSGALGHVVWMWAIEIVRRDLCNRITRMPDPEVSLDAELARNAKASG